MTMTEEAGVVDDQSQETLSTGDAGAEASTSTAESTSGDSVQTDVATTETGEKQYTLDDLMVESGISSPEELKSTLAYLDEMKGKLKGADLDRVLEQAKTLEGYEKTWSLEEELALREKEEPAETIARLEKQNKEMLEADQNRTQAAASKAETQKSMATYDTEVGKVLDSAKDLDPRIKDFLGNSLSSSYEANTIDPTDLNSVRRMVASEVAAADAFKRSIIEDYVAGKTSIADITTTSDSTPAPPKGPQSIKEAAALAKKMFKEGRIFQRA
jgi:hypothetical protein